MVPRFRFVVESLLRAIPGTCVDRRTVVDPVLCRRGHGHRAVPVNASHNGSAASVSRCSAFPGNDTGKLVYGRGAPGDGGLSPGLVILRSVHPNATFTMLNLFIAIIVSTMQSMVEEQKAQETAQIGELAQREPRSPCRTAPCAARSGLARGSTVR